jgi:hypothetical protein
MIAADAPWTTRAAISTPSDQARPQINDDAPKRATPTMNTRRRPRRSAVLPPSRSRPPKQSR